MKTDDITRALRNQTTPAARLARWQSRRAPALLHVLRSLPSYAGTTLAARRAYWLANYDQGGPELSSPEAETPILWIDDIDRSPLVLEYWEGRDFFNHRGWYVYPDGDPDETLEAYAVRLADFPGLIFEAHRDSCSGSVRVFLADAWPIDYTHADSDGYAEDLRRETAKEAIRAADSTAERAAEDEREYQERERHRADMEEARADLDRNRAEFRRIAAELRRLCPSALPADYPAAADAIKRQVRAILSERAELLDTIATHRAAIA